MNINKMFPHRYITNDARDLIKKLMKRNVPSRLGSGPRDSLEVQEHPFFETIDFGRLYRKEVGVLMD